MKLGMAAVLLSVMPIMAQDFVAPAPTRREIVVKVDQPKPTIEGIVKDIFVTKRPWQLVNPLAPKKYGTGEKFISKDFGPGTPVHSSTWTVASVEW